MWEFCGDCVVQSALLFANAVKWGLHHDFTLQTHTHHLCHANLSHDVVVPVRSLYLICKYLHIGIWQSRNILPSPQITVVSCSCTNQRGGPVLPMESSGSQL